MTLPPLAVENPALLPLLLAALIPLILHILDRRRARVVDWPAMRFVVLESKARLRRWRIREALLILTRSAAILFVALALAKPTLKETVAVRKQASPTRSVAFIVDTSVSMGAREGETSCLERAKKGVARVLDTLSPESRVTLVTSGRDSSGKDSEAVTVRDVPAAREKILQLTPQTGSFRLLDALDKAARVLESTQEPWSEIYVFTDLQWSMVSDADAGRWGFIRDRLSSQAGIPAIRLIDCSIPQQTNLFVSSVESPPLAVGTDEPAVLRVTLEFSGPAPESAVPVSLLSEGVEIARREVSLSSSAPTPVEFSQRFSEPGLQQLAVKVPADVLTEDDAFRFPLQVRDHIAVLVGGPSSRSDTRAGWTLSEADYVDLALAPRAAGLPQPNVIFRTDLEESPEAAVFSRFQVVVLAGIRQVTPPLAAKLESFVRGGGGLLLFAGSRIDRTTWGEELFRRGRSVLPAHPSSLGAAQDPGIRPRDILTTHPALSIFSGKEEGDLTSIRIRRWTKFLPPDAGSERTERDEETERTERSVTILGKVDAESPWMLEKALGKGKAITFATSASPEDSNLPASPLFLPLVNRIVRYLAAGESLLLAANVDPEESRLHRIADETLRSVQAALSIEITKDTGGAGAPTLLREVKRHLWPAALLFAILLAFVELALARGFARSSPPVAQGLHRGYSQPS